MTRQRAGFSLLIAIVLLGGMIATMTAFMSRVDSQTWRVTALKRGVQSLFAANEALELLQAKYAADGSLPASFQTSRPYGESEAVLTPTSATSQSYVAFVRGSCEGTNVVVLATLRKQAAGAGKAPSVLVENKNVFYGGQRIEDPAVRKALLAKLEKSYRELRKSMDEDRDLKRQGKLGDAYGGFLSETGLDPKAAAAALEALEK